MRRRPRAPPTMKTGAPKRTKDKDLDREPPVAIAARAVPLISLLKRAAAADAAVTWEESN